MWGRKRKSKTVSTQAPSLDRLAMQIAAKLGSYQRAAAEKLTKASGRLSKRMLAALFLLFGTGWIILAIYLISYGFTGGITLPYTAPHPPLFIDSRQYRPKPMRIPIIADSAYKKLEAFHRYFDSIKIHAPHAYDSILQIRPGLIDSLDRALGYHHPPKNN